jgi:hypothetical protein
MEVGMAGTLIVYFSRSGAVEAAVVSLAGRLKADIDSIRPRASYAGRRGYLRAIWQSIRSVAPEVGFSRDPATYDLVVLGFPIWAGKLAAPMRGYLRRNGPRMARTAAFCVSGSGMAYGKAFAEIARLGAPAPAQTLSLADRRVRGRTAEGELARFAESLRLDRRAAA